MMGVTSSPRREGREPLLQGQRGSQLEVDGTIDTRSMYVQHSSLIRDPVEVHLARPPK